MTKVERYARCGTPKPFWESSVKLRNRSLESRLEIERLTSGLEGGCWKSAQSSSSLAAYPTSRTVLKPSRSGDAPAQGNHQRGAHATRLRAVLDRGVINRPAKVD
jgi:hypothetical protein